jgi:aspartate-semialdehyde dehydrogenase
MGYRVAVVGATGNVGREILNILSEREFPADEVSAVASSSSVGKEVSFGDTKILKVESLENFDFSGFDIGFFSPGAVVSAEHAPRAAASGCIVVDNTSHFRMDPEIPLVVPEVNRESLDGFRNHNIVANPNCSTIQMVVALKPLHDLAPIRRVVVSTYQSVSGAGRRAMDELFDQTRKVFFNERLSPSNFPRDIAFNVIPHIDVFQADGSTKEERKMVEETQKILDPSIQVSATCVRVPVFVGHAEAVNVEFDAPISIEEARKALESAEGVVVIDDPSNDEYVTPLEAAGEGAVYVSRIREDTTLDYGLNLWVVSDNLRKGAALNSVQIAEALVEDYM